MKGMKKMKRIKKMKIGEAHNRGKGVFVAITVAIALVSVMCGVVICAGNPDPPHPPVPTKIIVTANQTCIPADGEAEALITARAVNDSGVPCKDNILVFWIEGPSDAELLNVSTGGPKRIDNRIGVWDKTDKDGYAHAILRAGTEKGTAVIHVYYDVVTAETEVVIADHCEGPELVVTDIEPNPNCGFLFANESNYINATVKNIGTEDAGAFNVSFQVGDKTEEIHVPGLAANSSTQVAVLDPTLRVAGVNVTIKVEVNCSDEVTEIDNTNNVKEVTVQVVNNGYKGKRYTGSGSEAGNGNIDITTMREYRVRGGFLYSTGDSRYLSGYKQPWYNYTVNWSTADLSIPGGKDAKVKEARLYVYYTWDMVQGMPDNVSLRFNNITVERDAFYTDRKGYDGYDYPCGMLAYNVTGEFNNSGNTAVLENQNPVAGNPSIRGMLLVVIYESESGDGSPGCKIFVNEGFDLLYGGSDKCTTPEEATAYAPFTRAIEDAGNRSARLITVAPGAGYPDPGEGELIFNGHKWSDVWNVAGDSQIGINECNVTPYLNTTNVAAFQSSGDYMEASNAILVVGGSKQRTGDMDGNGEVTFDDVISLAKHIYFNEHVSDDPDVNSDGKVTFDDVISLAKHIYFNEPIYP
ncbi:MAG: DUF3344 domain-containing protein [Methanophagales archaeon]|nr:DUF3344 domain-containing protein [Methanophagales archaeon]